MPVVARIARRTGNYREMMIMLIQTISGKGLRPAIVAAGLALIAVPHGASAGDLSAQQIIDGLRVSKTRSLSAPAQPATPT